jgi:hypothetical protein
LDDDTDVTAVPLLLDEPDEFEELELVEAPVEVPAAVEDDVPEDAAETS